MFCTTTITIKKPDNSPLPGVSVSAFIRGMPSPQTVASDANGVVSFGFDSGPIVRFGCDTVSALNGKTVTIPANSTFDVGVFVADVATGQEVEQSLATTRINILTDPVEITNTDVFADTPLSLSVTPGLYIFSPLLFVGNEDGAAFPKTQLTFTNSGWDGKVLAEGLGGSVYVGLPVGIQAEFDPQLDPNSLTDAVYRITGNLQVDEAGTLTLQAAQSVASGVSYISPGSNIRLTPVIEA